MPKWRRHCTSALVTDTGRFQYSNTTPEAHRIAAELQELGCDVNSIYRRVYESVPLAKAAVAGKNDVSHAASRSRALWSPLGWATGTSLTQGRTRVTPKVSSTAFDALRGCA